MLWKTATVAEATMPNDEFVSRLMATPAGQEVISSQAEEIATRRKQAAERIVFSESETAAAIKRIDADLARATAEIGDLASQLRQAQERHGELTQRRNGFLESSHRAASNARAYLKATAPPELIAVEALAHLAVRSAKFQIRQRVTPDLATDELQAALQRQRASENRVANQALLKRAQRVLKEVRALIQVADADGGEAGRLRAYLAAPADLVKSLGGTP
jgi:hypothetical protein